MKNTSFTSGSNSSKLIVLILTTCLLTSCGGGGNKDDSTEVEPPTLAKTDWDDINWDQDDWQ